MTTKRPYRDGPTHTVEWSIEDDFITGEAVCRAPEGADCRVTCPEGCETWVRGDHAHELVPYGSCLAVEWWNNTSLLEAHSGGPEPLANGPIEVWWEGEFWAWGYPDTKGSQSCTHDSSYGNADGTRTCILAGCGVTFRKGSQP